MHVTTRIKDRKHENLLREKGFGGFPSLAFMDADGNVLAKPSGRSVKDFESTLAALGVHADLEKRIEAGETGLDTLLLLAEHDLGKVDGATFKTRSEALTDATDEQKKRIAQIIIDSEILKIAGQTRRSGIAGPAKQLLAMMEAGKMPSAGPRVAPRFWSVIHSYAMAERDPELARKAADGMKAALADDKQAASYIERFDDQATKLASWKTLHEKVEGGDTACVTDLTLVEYDLGFLQGSAFVTKAKELLEGATDEQKVRLEAGMLKAEFVQHTMAGRSRDPSALGSATTALLALLDAGKVPPKDVMLPVYGTLARSGIMTKNADLIERAAGLFEASGDKRVVGYVKNLRKQAAALREAEAASPADEGGEGEDK